MKRPATGASGYQVKKKVRKDSTQTTNSQEATKNKLGKKRKFEKLAAFDNVKAVVSPSGRAADNSGGKKDRKKAGLAKKKKGGMVQLALVREGAEAEDDFAIGESEADATAVGEYVEEGVKKTKKRRKAKLPVDVENAQLDGRKNGESGGVRLPSKKGEGRRGKDGKAGTENGKAKQTEKKDSGALATKGKKFVFASAPEDGKAEAMAAWFHTAYTGHFGASISPLETAEITGDCVVQFPPESPRTLGDLAGHLRRIVGPSWKEDLMGNKLASGQSGGSREPGSPVVLILSSSAKRCVDILRSVNEFGHECKPAKLFAKHFKVGEQVAMLKERVNIAAGTPDRLGKLAAMGALGLGELRFLIMDMLKNAKNCTLFDIQEIRAAFWEFYRAHLHERVVKGDLRLCFY